MKKTGAKGTGAKITYCGVRIHPAFEGIYIRGYAINGVAKTFNSGGEAFAFIDGLKEYVANEDGDLIEWEE